MSTAVIDQSLKNEIAMQRFLRREIRLMLELFEQFDQKLAKLIRREFRVDLSKSAFKRLWEKIVTLRTKLFRKARRSVMNTLSRFSEIEHEKEWAILAAALDLSTSRPDAPTVKSALGIPFSLNAASAIHLEQWLKDLFSADLKRIRDALTWTTANEDSTDQAVDQVVGTKDQSFRNGVVAHTRNNIRALVATVFVHVADVMRRALWTTIPGIAGLLWVSVLDSNTTDLCISRDHKVVMFAGQEPPEGASLLVPSNARPPAHAHCRSRMVALIEGQGLPKRRTYKQFLQDLPEEDQNKILGKTKAELLRQGKISLDDLVDETGKELTLDQLLAA